MITIAVGTFIHGFDELVIEADRTIGELGIEAFAQIGHSRIIPKNMPFERFLPQSRWHEQLEASRLLIAHAGVGLISDGLRAGCRVVVVPRKGRNSRQNPINDQTLFARRLKSELPISVCENAGDLAGIVRHALAAPAPVYRPAACEVPGLIVEFLQNGSTT